MKYIGKPYADFASTVSGVNCFENIEKPSSFMENIK